MQRSVLFEIEPRRKSRDKPVRCEPAHRFQIDSVRGMNSLDRAPARGTEPGANHVEPRPAVVADRRKDKLKKGTEEAGRER